jgi:hypothetical protein
LFGRVFLRPILAVVGEAGSQCDRVGFDGAFDGVAVSIVTIERKHRERDSAPG